MTHMVEHFTAHGMINTPGAYAHLLDGLPHDVGALCTIVQGVMIHAFWADQYGVQLTPERRAEVQLRFTARQFAQIVALDARPLSEARPPERRLVGNCRDYSVMLASILKHQGVPARARCGFGRYFIPGHFEDHWVCEYWNAAEQRWVLVDAQLDAYQAGVLQLSFNPLDVPRDQFIVAGKAWEMCRSGEADPMAFGIAHLKGLWFIRGNLVRDAASLNNMELLPWDSWGLADVHDSNLSPNDMQSLDEMAHLISGDVPQMEQVAERYVGDERWKVPTVICSYVDGEPKSIDLDKASVGEHDSN